MNKITLLCMLYGSSMVFFDITASCKKLFIDSTLSFILTPNLVVAATIVACSMLVSCRKLVWVTLTGSTFLLLLNFSLATQITFDITPPFAIWMGSIHSVFMVFGIVVSGRILAIDSKNKMLINANQGVYSSELGGIGITPVSNTTKTRLFSVNLALSALCMLHLGSRGIFFSSSDRNSQTYAVLLIHILFILAALIKWRHASWIALIAFLQQAAVFGILSACIWNVPNGGLERFRVAALALSALIGLLISLFLIGSDVLARKQKSGMQQFLPDK